MPPVRIARHEFAVGKLAPDTFRVVDFDGSEAISQLYHIEVNLVSNDPAIAFADVVGKRAALTMFRGDDPSPFLGTVVGFEQAGMHHGQTEYPYRYRAALVPAMARLALTRKSRIFQNLTVEEIVTKVLTEHEVLLDVKLDGTYDAREYCTQYQESDLAFVQRLLEYEGIYYYYDHSGENTKDGDGRLAERVVIRDTSAEDAVSIQQPAKTPYRQSGGLLSADGTEFVNDFVVRQQLVTAKAEVVDYNYRTADTKIVGTSDEITEQAAGSASQYGINADTPGRARALAGVRGQEIEAARLVMTGVSDVERLRSGYVYDLVDHYRDDLNQAYRITRVHHAGGQASAAQGSEGGASLGYRNDFTCIPASVAFRPPRLTPEPTLPGVLTARVETTGGDYAPLDEYGRYRVRFPFDQGDAGDAQATKAVRMAQPYTGPGYGHHFPVHAGAEMVVACVDGNVDRIVGLSTVWNSTETSPVTSDNATQNVLRSWGKNEIRFDDKKGAEDVYMHATKNHTVKVVNSESISVGADRSQSVGHDESLSVGNDQTETVGNTLSLTVGTDRTRSVGANDALTVGGNRSADIGGTDQTNVAGNRLRNCGASSIETVAVDRMTAIGATDQTEVGADQNVSVGGIRLLVISGDQTTEVGGDTAHTTSGALTMHSDGEMTLDSPSSITISSDSEITLVCGASSITLTPSGIVIDAVKVTSSASATHEIKGAIVSAAATGINEVKGSIVKLN